MSFNKTTEATQYKVVDPSTIKFSVFTSDEIRSLSILKISTPITFDSLGHPIKGGLYDPVLGPTDNQSPCGTCFRVVSTCPGHFGHIELPVPVVNPLFHKAIFTILKNSCLHCFKLQLNVQIKQLLVLKLQLLEAGCFADALDIDTIAIDLVKANSGDLEENIMEKKVVKKYVKLLKKQNAHMEVFLSRNTYNVKDKFLREAFLQNKSKQCIFCSQSLIKLTTIHNRIMCSVVDQRDKKITKKNLILMPDKLREYMRNIWENEKSLIQLMIPMLKSIISDVPVDVLFLDVIPVPPPIVRPCNILRDQVVEHPQNAAYKSILKCGSVVKVIIHAIQNENNDSEEGNSVTEQTKALVDAAQGATLLEKLQNAWQELQLNVDYLMNSENAKGGEQGLKQIIEKKDGLIRLYMMGKRVNFAARSVITPDPNLGIDEIGIPEAFAKKLTYPVPVTSWNVEELRRLVINGPDKHPGAVTIENEDGRIINISGYMESKRESLAKRLLTPNESNVSGVKIVHRHLQNGDVLLLNRQPTLHKPSIMAHTARVLKEEKTLRLHYANCKSYNADFDGDEMNAHYPQNEIARSEAYNIMSVKRQYLVPKDGTPLSGLIQDHVISGVRLSMRGNFFSKTDYHQLVYQSLSHLRRKIKLLPPTIIKPFPLWSGKQVLSTLIINITPKEKAPITLISTAKINSKTWETEPPRKWMAGGTEFSDRNTMTESEVVIRKGELLTGVLDKAHFGATQYGLAHCMFELYGGDVSSCLLSSLAKLFTFYLQWEGFTLGVKDILVVPEANEMRDSIIESCREVGNATAAEIVNLPPNVQYNDLVSALENESSINTNFRALLDRKYKTVLDNFTNKINKTCLPAGLLTQFPYNNLQLMVLSGAKGTTVNTMQISCLLGQIELEGKRPPVMVSGRSLPSFPPFETSPRAGGFIDGRFMTGIQPQEFFFHCMAGREGLIDTAVKTSKSGYLQRCLIKHLEGIVVNYDMTVRDSDDCIIQFAYGEDGMDVCKATFFKKSQLKVLDHNTDVIVDQKIVDVLQSEFDQKIVEKHHKAVRRWTKRNLGAEKRNSAFLEFSRYAKDSIEIDEACRMIDGRSLLTCNLLNVWYSKDEEEKKNYHAKLLKKCPDPLVSQYQADHYFGVVNEGLEKLIEDYLKNRKDVSNLDSCLGAEESDFKNMMKMKAMESLVPPGEPVGLLAAQSIGEPSTQMTLNTFHFAGRGEMNVTLGIPRLREILMMASSSIKTPCMDIPFKEDLPNLNKSAEKLQRKLCKVTVENILHKIDIHSELKLFPSREIAITLNFHFLPYEDYKHNYNVTPKQVLNYMEYCFFRNMFKAIWKASGKKVNSDIETAAEIRGRGRAGDDEADDGDGGRSNKKRIFTEERESSDEEGGNEDDDGTQAKLRKRQSERQEYEDPESAEDEVSDEEQQNDVDEASAAATKPNNEEDYNMVDEGFDEFDVKPDLHSLQVLNQYDKARNYTYDKNNYLWCQLIFNLPLFTSKVDLGAVLKSLAKRSIIYEVPHIKRAITYKNTKGQLILKTEGINIIEMFQWNDILDLNRLYSNDIHAIARTYGIEAACKVIVKEVQNVFGNYGINVDSRHLSLISDYMTYNGVFEPMSRKGMESSVSPLQQMSFESSLTFLKDAVIKGKVDKLKSASSCLMVGQPCKSGTGSFSLYNKREDV